jgi:hypothetical protein
LFQSHLDERMGAKKISFVPPKDSLDYMPITHVEGNMTLRRINERSLLLPICNT